MIIRRVVPDFLSPSGRETTWYENAQTKREYSRIIGGLAWPSGDRGAFAVVVAQSRWANPVLRRKDFYVVAETEQDRTCGIQDFFEALSKLTKHYCVEEWYGNPDDAGMMDLLYRWQTHHKTAMKEILGPGLLPCPAPYIDDPGMGRFMVSTIRKHLSPHVKILTLGKSSLATHLSGISEKDRPEDYPAVMALGYVMAAYDVYFDESEAQGFKRRWYQPLDATAGY